MVLFTECAASRLGGRSEQPLAPKLRQLPRVVAGEGVSALHNALASVVTLMQEGNGPALKQLDVVPRDRAPARALNGDRCALNRLFLRRFLGVALGEHPWLRCLNRVQHLAVRLNVLALCHTLLRHMCCMLIACLRVPVRKHHLRPRRGLLLYLAHQYACRLDLGLLLAPRLRRVMFELIEVLRIARSQVPLHLWCCLHIDLREPFGDQLLLLELGLRLLLPQRFQLARSLGGLMNVSAGLS